MIFIESVVIEIEIERVSLGLAKFVYLGIYRAVDTIYVIQVVSN